MIVQLPLLILTSLILSEAWQTLDDRRTRNLRGGYHYHTKRHMLPREGEPRKRSTSQRPKELRKKPSGHLTPLNEDDIENDEVVSVAVGPPAVRPKYDKFLKNPGKSVVINTGENKAGVNLVKDVLMQLGREFLSHQVSEDFVFGQYVGNAMKNLTADLKVRMQHDILELIVKYQKIITDSDTTTAHLEDISTSTVYSEIKDNRELKEKKKDTDEGWPDFNNLAKIVGR